jgi:hypothetical protein
LQGGFVAVTGWLAGPFFGVLSRKPYLSQTAVITSDHFSGSLDFTIDLSVTQDIPSWASSVQPGKRLAFSLFHVFASDQDLQRSSVVTERIQQF